MKSTNIVLNHVYKCKVASLCPNVYHRRRSETLDNIVQNRSQWESKLILSSLRS